MLHESISDVLVLSLTDDTARRSHIAQHFSEMGINDYRFVNAIPHSSAVVKAMYKNGSVMQYPNCFRCQKAICGCENNIIIPHQVANWLSFKRIWEIVADANGPVMICEDDVQFFSGGLSVLNRKLNSLLVGRESEKVLVRLGHSGLQTNISLNHCNELEISSNVVMSNVAHIMTPEFAQYLLENFGFIDTTSDIWVHNRMANQPGVTAYTVEPLIATDLSFNADVAKFYSRIHPKGIDSADKERAKKHIKRVSTKAEYKQALTMWLGDEKSAENSLVSNAFSLLKKEQARLIAKLSPSQPKREYAAQLDTSFETEYGFKNTFENWSSVDREGKPIPWMTYSANFYLGQLELSKCKIFEWGSGNSSLYFAENALEVTSIESNPDWFDYVEKSKRSNQYIYLKNAEDYCKCISETGNKYQLIIIDGDIFRRLECAYYAIRHLDEGGLIVLDNSDWLPNTTAFLRENGFTQIDFAGPGPINSYLWCTSVFFKGHISLPQKKKQIPGVLSAGIDQCRDIELSTPNQPVFSKEQDFTNNYRVFKENSLPDYVDVFASQEGEDVLLKRLLKWHYNKPGFYVDVGAHHPFRFSNTYHYYLNGWTGLNIDAKPGTKAQFDLHRPNDINLELGVANEEGALTYYEFEEPAFNTFDADSVGYAKTRTKLLKQSEIKVTKLSTLIDTFGAEKLPITFFNIDVEGLELEVLRSNNWDKIRPKVVIIEALSSGMLDAISHFLSKVNYVKVASTKNSHFYCEQMFWDEVK